jgi:hypothetical protein
MPKLNGEGTQATVLMGNQPTTSAGKALNVLFGAETSPSKSSPRPAHNAARQRAKRAWLKMVPKATHFFQQSRSNEDLSNFERFVIHNIMHFQLDISSAPNWRSQELREKSGWRGAIVP